MKLTNDRHEKFCLAMLEFGGDWKKVMDACEYKHSSSFFSQLKNSKKIQGRLNELQEQVVSDRIMDLTARLEMLSEIARDVSLNKNVRLSALRELHIQTGDSVQKIEMNSTTESVVRYIDIELPKIKDEKEVEINEECLDGLDKWLGNVDVPDTIAPMNSPEDMPDDLNELFGE